MKDNSHILKEKITTLVKLGESAVVEFKSAHGGFPGSFWETYSAYANTNGGVIVLGVAEKNGQFSFDGLSKETVTKYKKKFWDCAHNRGKVSACLPQESDVIIDNVDDNYFLICYIPRAGYELRPVYLGSNPFGNTYRRNHEGDYLCTDTEVRRMFADAEHDRHSKDGRILNGFNWDRDIDKETLRQYRQTFASLQPTHPWTSISDMDFLKKIRAYAVDYATGQEGLTMAGLLMFGNYDSITNIAADPSYFIDYREKIGTDDKEIRWTHRIYPDGLWEANLFQFYLRVYNRLIQSLPRPFILKDGIRQEETPAHDAVREALINCIIHNDLSALGNIVVEQTDDQLIFRNPGMMLVSKQQYFKGGRSVCRNPILQNIFMRLGRAERAGSGVDKIVGGWRFLGLPDPTVEEESRPDYVVLTLNLKPHLENGTPQVGPQTPQVNPDTPQDTPQVGPQPPQVNPDTPQDTPQGGPQTPQVNPDTIQDPNKVGRMEKRKKLLIEFCKDPKTLSDIMKFLGLKDRKNCMERYIKPLLSEGTLGMSEPAKPTSSTQRYIKIGN